MTCQAGCGASPKGVQHCAGLCSFSGQLQGGKTQFSEAAELSCVAPADRASLLCQLVKSKQ